MSKGIVETVAGVVLLGEAISMGAIMTIMSGGALTPLVGLLISAGAGLVLTGIGTMLAGKQINGFATTTRNPIAPWEVVYGCARTRGHITYLDASPPVQNVGGSD